jgi:hypothetical protein
VLTLMVIKMLQLPCNLIHDSQLVASA